MAGLHIVIELGLEPWTEEELSKTEPQKQLQLFNLNDFQNSVEYAKAAGFDTYYLWGAEWWYWMKTAHNDPRFWETAKNLML